MKLFKIFFVSLMLIFLISPIASAGDFDWIKDFNIRAEADPARFRARLGARFKIGNVEIDAVLSNVEKPADAYLVCRFGEMSKLPTTSVIEKYKASKGKGWGVVAKSLGIKPGSKEFHALKGGHDLYDDRLSKDKDKVKDRAKGKNR